MSSVNLLPKSPRWLKLVHGLLAWIVLAAFAPTAWAQDVHSSAATAATVSEHLQAQLAETAGPVSFLVVLKEQTDAQEFLNRTGVSAAARQTKAQALYDHLTAVARRTQAPLRAWLDGQGIPYRAFYLVNMIEVQGDAELVETLRRRPEVKRLDANPQVGQQLAVATTQQAPAAFSWATLWQTPTLPYGLSYTRAPEVWALGYRGQGIVIASQDTGVKWDHPALKFQYRGVISNSVAMTYTVSHIYNWYDYWQLAGRPGPCASDAQVPCDDHGHGTHTVGTMVGDATADGKTILGMAPDAQWIGCRNMRNNFGTPASYTACFEFFLAPYPQGGDPMTDGRPDLAPHIINNSWGCPPSEGCSADTLRQIVETMRAAGQMVVASAGNSGSSCSSVDDPIALYDAVFSVGAHTSSGNIASFSSRGPVTIDGSGRLKPDLSAPGVDVYSTYLNSLTYSSTYGSLSGTSMASPHVAGAVALLWSAVPTLTGQITLTEQILIKSATPVKANQCNEGTSPVSPNNTYGYGRLDVLAAVQMAQNPGVVEVQLLDSEGAPAVGIAVQVQDNLTGYRYVSQSDANGSVVTSGVYAGEYTVKTVDNPRFGELALSLQAGQQQSVVLQQQRVLFLPLITKQ